MKRLMKVQVRMGGWDNGHGHSMRQTTGHALREKYKSDVKSERKRQSGKEGRQKRGGEVWFHPVYSPHSPSSVGT